MKSEKTNSEILEESLLEYKAIINMVDKNSENMVKDIVSEKVTKGLKDMITEANDSDEDSNADEGKGLDDTDIDAGIESEIGNEPGGEEDINVDIETPEGDGMGPEGEAEAEPEGETEDGEDFNFDDFKSGDDEYDLTNSSIDDVVKVFKRIKDDDSIIVKNLEDGKVELIDNEAGTDYLIDTTGDSDSNLGGEDDSEIEIELDDDNEETQDESVEESELGEGQEALTEEDETQIELEGTEDNVYEKNMTQSIGTNRRAGHMTQTRKENAPGVNNRDGAKLIANESKKLAKIYDGKMKKLEESYKAKLKEVNDELEEYKKVTNMFRDKLKENAVLNNNLAKYVKLVTENATSKEEKMTFLKRFSEEANTIEAGNNLFESISKEIKNKVNNIGVNIDKPVSASSSAPLNEQVIYQSKDLQETINLMNRISRL